MERWAG